MAITPSTTVFLIKAPLEYGDNNTLNFANATAQHNYFMSLPKIQSDNFTYQRENSVIRFPAHIDDILQYNYVAYQNDNYSDKWFYAFITGMNYLNDNVTEISITTDTFQTWQFELEYKPCYVEREHTKNDAIGANTIPEGLELGEPVGNGTLGSFDFGVGSGDGRTNYAVCFQVSEPLGAYGVNVGKNPTIEQHIKGRGSSVQIYNGIASGLYLFSVLEAQAQVIIDGYNINGKSDAIVSIFYAPLELTTTSTVLTSVWAYDNSGDIVEKTVALMLPSSSSTQASDLGSISMSRPATIDGYYPKNNKLYTYPYNYFIASNNNGESYTYHYEDFASSNFSFQVKGALCQGVSAKAYPNNYKNFGTNYDYLSDYSINSGKFPVIAWASDYYTNWIVQNSPTIATGLASDMLGASSNMIGAGLGTQPAGLIAGGVSTAANMLGSVLSTVGEMERAKRIPDQAKGNITAGDINFSMGSIGFNFKGMSVRSEIAKVIDGFFSMYGYKTNSVKVPNVTGRANWNYVKTVGCYIGGDIPQEDMNEIKAMFDSGITIWHNPNTFLDYSQNNGII